MYSLETSVSGLGGVAVPDSRWELDVEAELFRPPTTTPPSTLLDQGDNLLFLDICVSVKLSPSPPPIRLDISAGLEDEGRVDLLLFATGTPTEEDEEEEDKDEEDAKLASSSVAAMSAGEVEETATWKLSA